MIKIDMKGKACPIPLIETKKVVNGLNDKEKIEVLVDNSMAVSNIKTYAEDNGFLFEVEKVAENEYKILITVNEIKNENASCCGCGCESGCGCDSKIDCEEWSKNNIVVAIGSNQMGMGDEKLGKNLLKAFIYSLTQEEVLPKTILFYNSGAYLTCEDSLSIEDLTNLENLGVKIFTCGTCLDFYGLKEKLKVGKVTNMYDIVAMLESASVVIKP